MAGVDAAEFLRQHAGRAALVHLKDRAKGTPVHYDIATVPNETFREVGSGDLPLKEILAAIVNSNAKHAFVEVVGNCEIAGRIRLRYSSVVLSSRSESSGRLRRPTSVPA